MKINRRYTHMRGASRGTIYHARVRYPFYSRDIRGMPMIRIYLHMND